MAAASATATATINFERISAQCLKELHEFMYSIREFNEQMLVDSNFTHTFYYETAFTLPEYHHWMKEQIKKLKSAITKSHRFDISESYFHTGVKSATVIGKLPKHHLDRLRGKKEKDIHIAIYIKVVPVENTLQSAFTEFDELERVISKAYHENLDYDAAMEAQRLAIHKANQLRMTGGGSAAAPPASPPGSAAADEPTEPIGL